MDSDIKRRAAEIKHTALSRVLVAYLQELRADVATQLVITKDVIALRQLQGRAQMLDEEIIFFIGET